MPPKAPNQQTRPSPQIPFDADLLRANLPEKLIKLRQWVAWKYVQRGGRWTKIPLNPVRGGPASATDPGTWGSFEQAVTACQRRQDLAGVGFVFADGGPYIGIDVDACCSKQGIVDPEILELIKPLQTYGELSPSGRGVHLILKGKKPGSLCRKGNIEVYDRARFFCMTGDRLSFSSTSMNECGDGFSAFYTTVFGAHSGGGNGAITQTVDVAPNPTAEVPANKLQLLLESKPQFRATWERRRLDLKDQSASSYDLSLASIAASAGWSDGEIAALIYQWRLKHNEDRAKALRTDYINRTISKARSASTDRLFKLGAVSLRPESPRVTASGSMKVPTTVLAGGREVDRIVISESAASRKQARRILAVHGVPTTEVDSILGRILTAAATDAADRTLAAGETVAQIVRRIVPGAFNLTHRTARGAWSETRDAEITRPEFITHTPEPLIVATCGAVDAPRMGNGTFNRTALVRTIRTELEILWSTTLAALPVEEGAHLGATSAAGRRFRDAMLRLWTATRTFQINRTGDGSSGDMVAARASLASRTQRAVEEYLRNNSHGSPRPRWLPVQSGFDAWWRPRETQVPALVLLSMRANLCHQIGESLPGVRDQASLTRLCTKYGITDDTPSVPDRLTGGGRLVVLGGEITAEIMSKPEEPEETDTKRPGGTTRHDGG